MKKNRKKMKTSHIILFIILSAPIFTVIWKEYDPSSRPPTMEIKVHKTRQPTPPITPKPFAIPISGGRIDKVRQLIKEGHDVNAKDNGGRTPLHVAVGALDLNLEIISLLLKHGADVNAKDRNGNRPLHFLGETNNIKENTKTDIQVISLLLKHDADINARNEDGRTILHRSNRLSSGIIHLLLKHGADINVKDKEEETPLYSLIRGASESNCSILFEKVKLLIRFGANPKIKMYEGSTITIEEWIREDYSWYLKKRRPDDCKREAYSKIVHLLDKFENEAK